MIPNDGQALLTPREVALLFRVDSKTVCRWEQRGKLRAIRTLGNQRRFPYEEIVEALVRGGVRREDVPAFVARAGILR